LDDRAISEASKHPSLSLSAGEHKIELVNYGYTPVTRTVNIKAGKTATLELSLQAVGEKVLGSSEQSALKVRIGMRYCSMEKLQISLWDMAMSSTPISCGGNRNW